jgi:hypothetical protein
LGLIEHTAGTAPELSKRIKLNTRYAIGLYLPLSTHLNREFRRGLKKFLQAVDRNLPLQLLAQVSQRVDMIEAPGQRQEAAVCSRLLTGLRFNKQLIQQFFREGIMRESVIYQDILREVLQQGLERGLEQGKQQEGVALVLRQLTHHIGALASEVKERIRGLSIAQLEELAEALLDFSQPMDLMNCLEGHPDS